MIEINNICKQYGDKSAIENISFKVEKGHPLGLLGHNGCGKSTTMNIITGCLAPTSGSVVVDGVSMINEPAKAKTKIGYLPEIAPVYPDMTVDEQLFFAASLRKIKGEDAKREVATVCEELNITGVRPRLIKNLSKGYKQRVGFAQALIGHPENIILDEPMVGLDPGQIRELREFIRKIGKDHALIISSHILSEISEICDRVVMLSSGRLTLDADMEEIKKHNRSRFLLVETNGSDNATETDVSVAIKQIEGVVSCEPYGEGTDLEEVFMKYTKDERYKQ